MIKIGINGFGRIGRFVFRASLEAANAKDVVVVGINDLCPVDYLAYMLKYDTMHGQFNGTIDYDLEKSQLIVNGNVIRVTAERNPADLKWNEIGAEYVVESTGLFLSKEKSQGHLDAGAKYVVMSAPSKDDTPMFVCGVNDDKYDNELHNIISNASCTTNCLAPVAKVIDAKFGIENGMMTTVHAYTNDQQVLDKTHKDLRRARACAGSIIPTTTGAAKAVSLVLPELEGKLNGFSLRVPTQTVSVVDLVVNLKKKDVTVEEINAALKEAAENELNGILGYCDKPLVSVDFKGDKRSSIVDALSTMVMSDGLVKVISWYDNEWGYAERTADLVNMISKKLK